MIKENLKKLEEGISGTISHFKDELRSLRSNRPSVDLVENITVEVYDDTMTIKQLGSISIVPPREINVEVWDQDVVKPLINALDRANMGFSVSNEGNLIRAKLSPLSDERRQELVRTAKKIAEEARIQVRQHREDALKKAKAAVKDDEISEDEERQHRSKVQKRVDEANEKIEEILEQKIEELKN